MRAVALLLLLAGAFGVAALWQSRRVSRLEEERDFARRVEAGEVRATSEEEIPAGWATVVLGGTSPARTPQPATESMPTNAQVPPTSEPAATAPSPSPDFELIVEPGQSLSKIARAHYGTAPVALVRALARYNGLADEGSLQAGQTLRLPPVEMLQR
jgi:nucleoid-associated protein YgaU